MATEQMPQPGDLRASDADRQRVADLLREHCAQGRLTLDEFDERLGQTLASKTLAQLQEPLRDLPVRFQPSSPKPVAATTATPAAASKGDALRAHLITYATTMVFLVAIWFLTTPNGYFWPIWPMIGWGLPVALHGLNRSKPDRPKD